MSRKTSLLLVSLSLSLISIAQVVQTGPYTITTLADGVYHIEDSNDSNPAGNHFDKDGKPTGLNNCSDMYLITGRDKALLIDLSNAVKWDTTAAESLRKIVYDRAGDKKLLITVTHKHGDHLGMLPAFKDDPKAAFWIPEAEFRGMNIFPAERTTFFTANESIDLGGNFKIKTMEVPGHTDHSTLFFLQDKNIVFTGDAIGSGSGVWLFSYENFINYKPAVSNLVKYIEDPSNKIDINKLVIYGGHVWQKGSVEKLTGTYIYDMQTLIDRIGLGTAEIVSRTGTPAFLDANFKYGTATITWNREAALKYGDWIRDSQ